MKAKLEYCLRWLREGAVRVVRSYPVETLLALYACIRCLLTYELDWSEEELFNRLGLVPLFFALGAGEQFGLVHSGFTYGALGMDVYRFD